MSYFYLVPEMSIWDYLARIKTYSRCSDSCFIVALIYIDRAIEIKNLVLSHLNVHRILITSILIAVKFLDDSYMNNAFYAQLGGITTNEMNMLELDFLLFLGFSLQVSSDLFSAYHNELKGYVNSNNFLPLYDDKSFDSYQSYCESNNKAQLIQSIPSGGSNTVNNNNNTNDTSIAVSPFFPFYHALSESYVAKRKDSNPSPDYVNVSPSYFLNGMESTLFSKDQARFLISYSGYSVQF